MTTHTHQMGKLACRIKANLLFVCFVRQPVKWIGHAHFDRHFSGPVSFCFSFSLYFGPPKNRTRMTSRASQTSSFPFFFFFPPPKKKKKKKKKINKTVDPSWWFSSHLSSCYSSVFSSSSTFSLTELPCVWETQRRPRRSPNLAEWVIRLRERHTHTQRDAQYYTTQVTYTEENENSLLPLLTAFATSHTLRAERFEIIIWRHCGRPTFGSNCFSFSGYALGTLCASVNHARTGTTAWKWSDTITPKVLIHLTGCRLLSFFYEWSERAHSSVDGPFELTKRERGGQKKKRRACLSDFDIFFKFIFALNGRND